MSDTYRLEQTPSENFMSSYKNKCPIELSYYDERTGERKFISVLIYEVISPTHFRGSANNNRIVEIMADKFSAEIMFTGWLVNRQRFFYPLGGRRLHLFLLTVIGIIVSAYYVGVLSHDQLRHYLDITFIVSAVAHGLLMTRARDASKELFYITLGLASLALLWVINYFL